MARVSKDESVVVEGFVEATPVAQATRRRSSVFNGTASKLQVQGEKLVAQGYHLHILNDTAGRIQAALDNGYEFVLSHEVDGIGSNVTSRNTDTGDKIRFLVGTLENGGPMYAYLMKIKQEWYDEDQRELQSKNDMIDNSIRGGKVNIPNTNEFYTRPGEIQLKT